MKIVIVLAALVAVAVAVPVDSAHDAQILKNDFDNIGVDGYHFHFESSDGTSRHEDAELKNIGTENEAIAVKGSFTYLGEDGQQYTINYVADENGFQPQGAHLPVAP